MKTRFPSFRSLTLPHFSTNRGLIRAPNVAWGVDTDDIREGRMAAGGGGTQAESREPAAAREVRSRFWPADMVDGVSQRDYDASSDGEGAVSSWDTPKRRY